jgi:hypothetical protein
MDRRGAEQSVAQVMLEEPYVGEMDDGRFHGFGRMVLRGGEEYAGEFEHGRRHGNGTAVWPDGLKYIGEWHANVATGVGCLSWPSGGLYFGEVRRGQRFGLGVFRAGESKYIGEWRDGKRHGWGTQLTPEYTYTGNWVDGHRHGWGTIEFASLNRYAGEWEGDRIHGRGTMLWVTLRDGPDALSASAMHRKSQRDLLANLRARTRNVGTTNPGPLGPFTPCVAASADTLEQYVGEWVNNNPHGRGRYKLMFKTAGSQRDVPFEAINEFRGTFRKGVRHGQGIQHFADGTTYEGTWAQNLKEGPGIIHHRDGSVEHVVMKNDAAAEASQRQARGGSSVMAYVRIDDLFEGLGSEAAEQQRKSIEATVARASNTLHHLFNVYSHVAAPYDFSAAMNAPPSDIDLPAPDHAPYIDIRSVHVPIGAQSVERNALIAEAIGTQVTMSATLRAAKAFDALRMCEDRFNTASRNNSVDFFGSPRADSVSSPMSPNTGRSSSLASTRRPATPQVDADGPTHLESLLPPTLSNEQPSSTELRLTYGRLHVLLSDAQLLDAHFSGEKVAEALAPLRKRLEGKPVRESALSYPSFVEAVIRLADYRLANTYPFFASNTLGSVDLRGRVEYVIGEFLTPLCLALRDLDFCKEFNRLGIDRYVFEGSDNATVDDIRKSAIRAAREKARLTKMKERTGEGTADSIEQLGFAVTVSEMDLTMRLGDTVRNLTCSDVAADPAMIRRIDRPSSASVDMLESMDLPSGPTSEKITATVKFKQVLGGQHTADIAVGSSTSLPVSPNLAPAGSSLPSLFSGHLEVWFVLVNIRHGNAVHFRAHAIIVSVAKGGATELVSVLPSAALHRATMVAHAPVPADIRKHLRGAQAPRDPTDWAIKPHAPVLASHLTRFAPVASIVEANLAKAVSLYRRFEGRPWHLVDALGQLGLAGPLVQYDDAASRQHTNGRAEEAACRLPADVLLRNLFHSVFGHVVDSACSAVTSVDPCKVPPVYDAAVLRAFLKRSPDLAAALQIVAMQEDQRRAQRDLFRNLRTPVGVNEWWTVAQSLTATLDEFIQMLVATSYFIYAAPAWSPVDGTDREVGAEHTPVEEFTFAAAETGSSLSAGSFARGFKVPPAITSVAMTGLCGAMQQFVGSWEELLRLPRRTDHILPAAHYTGKTPEVLPLHASATPPTWSSLPPSPTLEHFKPGTAKDAAKAKDVKNAAVPVAPPAPAHRSCVHPRARLGPVLLNIGGVADPPPVRYDKPLPVRPRTAPIEDPKKKKPVKK